MCNANTSFQVCTWNFSFQNQLDFRLNFQRKKVSESKTRTLYGIELNSFVYRIPYTGRLIHHCRSIENNCHRAYITQSSPFELNLFASTHDRFIDWLLWSSGSSKIWTVQTVVTTAMIMIVAKSLQQTSLEALWCPYLPHITALKMTYRARGRRVTW